MIWAIDQDGWTSSYESAHELENNLEWIDINSGEYVIVDDNGIVWGWKETDGTPYGYSIHPTSQKVDDCIPIIRSLVDDQQIPQHLLSFVKKIGPSSKLA